MTLRNLIRPIAVLTGSAAIAVGAMTLQAGADPSNRARGAGELRDLQLATHEPTDHATAQVVASESGGSTTVTLKVQGIEHAAEANTYGAHVHTGTCVEGNGAAAGPHFNSTGGATISNQTEVWLDFTVDSSGTARSSATVPFTIAKGGAGAVVIHAAHTNATTGAAGARWACLPVQF